MLDNRGYRLNVGIVVTNNTKQVLWAKRAGKADIWQFPQGGIQAYETIKEAMYRELYEEIGLTAKDVRILAISKHWLNYELPRPLRRSYGDKLCIGQKQKWFLLHLVGGEARVHFANSVRPEFDAWQWVDYWYPLEHIVSFKRKVYESALAEFAHLLF